MPRYHFVVRAPDHTHDDPLGTHFPNHEAAREHGHRIVRELREGHVCPPDPGRDDAKARWLKSG
jgi:hypothetical protein